MTISRHGFYALSSVTPAELGTPVVVINSSAIQDTYTASFSATSGQRYLVLAMYIASGGSSMAVDMTLDGNAVTQIDEEVAPNNDPGIWVGEITAASTSSQDLVFNNTAVGHTPACCIAVMVPIVSGGTFGTATKATTATASSYSAAFTINNNGGLLIGMIAALDGNNSHTPDATAPTVEIVDAGTGTSTTADGTFFVGTISVDPASSPTWGSSWGASEQYVRFVIELGPA